MSEYSLNEDTIFIDSSDGYKINLWSRSSDALHGSSLVAARDWVHYGTVDPGQNERLEVFGTIIKGQLLINLATELRKYEITTNREGYLYSYLSSGSSYVQRLNDMFCWSLFGVKPTVTTIWNRCNWDTGQPLVDLQAKDELLKDFTLKLETAERALDLCKRSFEEKQKEVSGFGQRLEDKEEERCGLEKRLEEKRKEFSQLEMVFEEKERQRSVLEKRLEEKRNQCSELEKRLHEKEKQCSPEKEKQCSQEKRNTTAVTIVRSMWKRLISS